MAASLLKFIENAQGEFVKASITGRIAALEGLEPQDGPVVTGEIVRAFRPAGSYCRCPEFSGAHRVIHIAGRPAQVGDLEAHDTRSRLSRPTALEFTGLRRILDAAYRLQTER